VRRSEQRRRAIVALYQRDLTGRPLSDTLAAEATPFTHGLAYAVEDYQEELDAQIARHAKNWTLDRIAPLERAVLRVAVLEMLHPEAVLGEKPVPPEAAIDEAVETAKEFCGADAPGFVNGVLGAILREKQGVPG
jgi:transcription antitermination protein NusB